MSVSTITNNSGFLMLTNDLLNIEKIAGKPFTGNMKIVYSLIQGYERNGQIAYFSQDTLKRQLGITTPTVVKLIRDMVELGLINKTGQIGGKTCHYTTNPITPKMIGNPKGTESTVETLENAGTYQPDLIECGSESNDSSDTAEIAISAVDSNRDDVCPTPAYNNNLEYETMIYGEQRIKIYGHTRVNVNDYGDPW